MTTLLNVRIWKKGTNKYTSMPDYTIEIEEGDSYKIRELIKAIKGLHDKVAEMVAQDEKRKD